MDLFQAVTMPTFVLYGVTCLIIAFDSFEYCHPIKLSQGCIGNTEVMMLPAFVMIRAVLFCLFLE